MPLWSACVNGILDILIVVTIPCYIIFLRHLYMGKPDNIYTNGFLCIVYANGFWNLISSVINIFFNELPQQGIIVEFYYQDPLWKARMSKAAQYGIQFFQLLSLIVLALNRWLALKRPIPYSRIFSYKNMSFIYCILYASSVAYMLPILFVAETTSKYDLIDFHYAFVRDSFAMIYELSYLGMALIAFVVWLIVYLKLLIFLTKKNVYEQSHDQIRVMKLNTRMTAATFMFSVGIIILFIINLTNEAALRIFGIKHLYPIPIFQTLCRIAQEWTNLSPPWIMIGLFPEVREGIKIILGVTQEPPDNELFVVRKPPPTNVAV